MFFGALAFATSASFVSCKDYDDDINRLDKEISNVKDAISVLEGKVGSGKYVESCTPFTTGNGGYEIKFSDGETVKIYNGAKGDTGATGAPGSSATNYVVSVKEGATAYDLVITYADGTTKTISMPKATSVLSGIKFIPTYLSTGEAARIHFPTIVTDSITGREDIAGNDWDETNYKSYKIVYSGKADVKYQANPNSVSFNNIEVVGFVRDTAEIWNYSTNDKKWEMFDAGQVNYTDGKLTIASYKEGHGMLNFRVKDWAFAEQSNLNERSVYSLRIKNGDNIVHSDFIPAKHEVILQKNVHLVKIADAFDQTNAPTKVNNAITPNKVNYREFIADNYYRKSINPAGTEAQKLAKYQADKATFEANAENQLYKGAGESKNDADRIVVELNYTGDGSSKDLKDIVTAFFDKRVGRDQTAQYPLKDNGFDDYSLVFEAVDFYYDGVNQTKRYLNVDSKGLVSVKQTPDPIWGAATDAEHTAAIDRTPIVRVKLVAPGYEDNANVVKTAIVKIHIVRKVTVPEINITETKDVTLLHTYQNLDMDMDKIFNHSDVQMSKDEFRKAYVFEPELTEALAKAATCQVYTWDGKDNYNYSPVTLANPHEYNQLFVTVKNTAFSTHDDHNAYIVKGTYKPNAAHAGLPDIHVTYTINVKYPTVVAPTKTALNWVNGEYIAAHGRYDNFDNPKDYEMVSVLNESFDLINYNPYKGQTVDKNTARATLSFELVDQHNNASLISDTHDSGINLYQGADGKWYIALEATDAGRKWINAANATTLNKIKMRAVVSFNEAVDGLYGTCTKANDAHFKYAKQAKNNFSCDTINMVGKTPWTEDVDVSKYKDGDKAPETGRSTVVIKEFEIAFITPMVFHANEVKALHDKYQEAENTVSLKEAFFLSDYLWSEGAQAQFNNNHVIYDFVNAATNNTLVATGPNAGWSQKLVVTNNVFSVQKPVNFKVVKATYADGSSLDAENMKKIKLDNTAQTITWINNGQDIANPFTIEVEVCVNHKWGEICDHTWKGALGHSVGIVKIAVKKYNEK